MKKVLIIIVLFALSLSGFSQYIFKNSKATAKMDTIVSIGDTLYLVNKLNNNKTKLVIRNGILQLPTLQGIGGELKVNGDLTAGGEQIWLNESHTSGISYDLGSLYLQDPSINSGNPISLSSFLLTSDTSALARKSVVNDSLEAIRADIGSGGGGTSQWITTGAGIKYTYSGGDSLSVLKNGTIRQSRTGVEVLSTTTNGDINISGGLTSTNVSIPTSWSSLTSESIGIVSASDNTSIEPSYISMESSSASSVLQPDRYISTNTSDSITIQSNEFKIKDETGNSVKLNSDGNINLTGQIKAGQLTAALTDGIPTASEINSATGLTPSSAGIGYQVTIKDNNGTGLLYKIESDGTDWYYTAMTKSL